jgi:integrase
MDGMPRPRPPFIQREVTRHKKVLWYFRRVRGGPRIRLPDEYGSEAFWKAYNAALNGEQPRPQRAEKGTLAWMVEQYKASARWAKLAPSTQRARDRLLATICKTAGHAPVKQITKADLQRGVDQRAGKPEAANAFIKTVRAVLNHAVKMEIIETNPAAALDLLRSKAEGFHTWTMEEIEAYERRHPIGTKARLAMDLMLYTGLRKSDAVQVGHQHIRDGVLTIRPEKTKRTSNVTVTIRILPPLAESIAATKTGDLHLIVTEYGRPFTANGFGNWFRARCDEAGVSGSAHGLRKAGATKAAENGATTHELMAMFGWTTTAEAERYTKAADRRRMGIAGSTKLSRTKAAG